MHSDIAFVKPSSICRDKLIPNVFGKILSYASSISLADYFPMLGKVKALGHVEILDGGEEDAAEEESA